MPIEIRSLPEDRTADVLMPIATTFGMSTTPAHVERLRAITELELRLGAFDGDALVGGAGSFTFQMTVPGGASVEIAGLTIVGVLPTHRRRGILRSMMRHHLDWARARGQVVASLWASEGPIYGRFGYGLAALGGDVELSRHHTAFIGPPAPPWQARLVGEAEAFAAFPPIWERVRPHTPGMLSRSESWWRVRRLADPDVLRGGRGPLQRVLLAIDGRPAAYALYHFAGAVGHRDPGTPIDVLEAIGDSPEATRAVWRYLLDIDIAASFKCLRVPVDHPLLSMLADPRRLGMNLRDTLWIRLVDVAAALSRRGYGPGGPLVIEVNDAFCPWNTGRYRLADGAATRTEEPADVAMDVDALGALYLGAFGMTQLAQAGRVVERTSGALARGDVLFRGARAPWCPDTF
jgi:predicted acetyltransferase